MSADAPGIFRGKHLVVFGAGYVGGEVARQAVVAGLRVTALTRNVATVADLAALGHREAGTAAIEFYSEWKTLYLDYSDRLQRAQIDS